MKPNIKMEKHLEIIKKIVSENRLISKRIEALEKIGYKVEECAMGSGGLLQQKKMSDGTTRIQIGYGHGRWNYAMAVILKMTKQIIYSENFEKSTLWVENEDFKCSGSFIRENEGGTYTACLNDSVLGTKFKTIDAAKKAVQKFANNLES